MKSINSCTISMLTVFSVAQYIITLKLGLKHLKYEDLMLLSVLNCMGISFTIS